MRIPGIEGEVYFHGVQRDRRLGIFPGQDNRWVRKGRWMRARDYSGEPVFFDSEHEVPMCEFGMHACKEASGLFLWWSPHVRGYLSLVQLRGVVRHFDGKSVGEERRVLFIRRITKKDWERLFNFDSSREPRVSMILANWVMNPHLALDSLLHVDDWLVPYKFDKRGRAHRNFSRPNFMSDGKLYLTRCYECGGAYGKENYLPAVATGQCAFCGWSSTKEDKDGTSRKETSW